MRADRVVLDTNVLISAFLSPLGKPFACLEWVLFHARLLASNELLTELETRLARPKFSRYAAEETRNAYVSNIRQNAVLIPLAGTLSICRDPDDDKLLEIAVAGIADCIVTGDQDLLVLDPFGEIRILTPAAFLEALIEENHD